MGLAQTRGSGCGLIEKGDLGSGSSIHVEAKSCRTQAIRIDIRWYLKAQAQARAYRKSLVLLQIAFMKRFQHTLPHLRWVGMSAEVFHKIGFTITSERSAKRTFCLRQTDKFAHPFSVTFSGVDGTTTLCFVPEIMLTSSIIERLTNGS